MTELLPNEEMTLVVRSSLGSMAEVSRRTVAVRITPKRIRVLSGSHAGELFGRDGKHLARDRHMSMYRYRLEPLTALRQTQGE